ncbi:MULTISPECIES: SDR family oxidoreductase [Streptomyces]|uniref:SDR family oxidoreductase n=2 Tax=Streptomyces TaxID=1883 RepID=A0ABV9JA21_9ACTN
MTALCLPGGFRAGRINHPLRRGTVFSRSTSTVRLTASSRSFPPSWQVAGAGSSRSRRVSARSDAPNMAHYMAAKGGVIGLAKRLAYELAPRGITLNTTPPSVINTRISVRAVESGDMPGAHDAGYITGQSIGAMAGSVCDATMEPGWDSRWLTTGGQRTGGDLQLRWHAGNWNRLCPRSLCRLHPPQM